MAGREKDVLLIIADISGYTNFMVNSKITLLHAQTMITTLINAVIREARVPLKVAKLEGDAVFLVAVKTGSENSWARELSRIKKHITGFFAAFKIRANELAATNNCSCNACTMVQELKLKVVIHYGKALFYTVSGHREIAGPDVILVHRLLKNPIKSPEYIALTSAAFTELGLKDVAAYEQINETYDAGSPTLLVTYPAEKLKAIIEKIHKKNSNSLSAKTRDMMAKISAMLPIMMGLNKRHYHNLPAENGQPQP